MPPAERLDALLERNEDPREVERAYLLSRRGFERLRTYRDADTGGFALFPDKKPEVRSTVVAIRHLKRLATHFSTLRVRHQELARQSQVPPQRPRAIRVLGIRRQFQENRARIHRHPRSQQSAGRILKFRNLARSHGADRFHRLGATHGGQNFQDRALGRDRSPTQGIRQLRCARFLIGSTFWPISKSWLRAAWS